MKTPLMPRLLDDLNRVQEEDTSYEIYPHPQWQRHSALAALAEAYHTVHNIPPPPLWLPNESSLQAKITKHIWSHHAPHQHHNTTAVITLARRLGKAGYRVGPAELLPHRLRFALKALRDLPPFVQFSYFRFIFNAWNTSYRYGKTVASCRWCGLAQSDRLDHYASCSSMLSALQIIRPLLFWSCVPTGHPPLRPQAPLRMFGLDLSCYEEATDLVMWLDFLHSLYSSGLQPGRTAEQWKAAWGARQRVVHRYITK